MAGGVCALLLIGTAVLVTGDDDPADQMVAGPSPTGSPPVSGTGEIEPSPEGTTSARSMANGLIAFIRSTGPEDPAPKIYVMNGDGSEQRMIAETTRGGALAWSPDGTRLAFSDVGGIYVVNADGTGEQKVPSTSNYDDSPAWSPDGSKLAFGSPADLGIFVINVDGTGRSRLADDNGWSPAWSPDGQRIAFSAGDAIFIINADGRSQRKLTSVAGSAPAWSPDGSQIAFRHNSAISAVDLDDGDVRQLATPGGTAVVDPNGKGANKLASGGGEPDRPRWSPDGTMIVYGLYQSGQACGIWVMNADGSGQTQLTDNGTCDRDPSWQPRPA